LFIRRYSQQKLFQRELADGRGAELRREPLERLYRESSRHGPNCLFRLTVGAHELRGLEARQLILPQNMVGAIRRRR
jgi:hypothetical protein